MQKSKLTIAELAKEVPQILKKRSGSNRSEQKFSKSYTTILTQILEDK